jgi:cytochrome oxidase Cu insertion factor (SCO1/SenC/PrrC family)
MRWLVVLALIGSGCGAITGIDATAPPTTSDRASTFTLADQQAKPVTLAGLLEHGDVALVFFRGHW